MDDVHDWCDGWAVLLMCFVWGVTDHAATLAPGIVAFVMSLRKRKLYKYQFKQFAFCHMALLVVVFQSTFLAHNVFNGLLWYVASRAGAPFVSLNNTWLNCQVHVAEWNGGLQRLLCVHFWLFLGQNGRAPQVLVGGAGADLVL